MPNKNKKALYVPKKIKIGYSVFDIESRKEDWKIKHKAVGRCQVDKSLIEYATTQCDSEIVNTVIHEILHAIIYVFDIEFDTDKKEEYLVKKMANGIQTVLSDNPDFIKWLSLNCSVKK
jgi:hypothetical protein